jgi:hypothetical protein
MSSPLTATSRACCNVQAFAQLRHDPLLNPSGAAKRTPPARTALAGDSVSRSTARMLPKRVHFPFISHSRYGFGFWRERVGIWTDRSSHTSSGSLGNETTERTDSDRISIASPLSRLTSHVSRFTFHVSRFTLHVSRFTFHFSSHVPEPVSHPAARMIRPSIRRT